MQMVIAALLLAVGPSEPGAGEVLVPMPTIETEDVAEPCDECNCPEGFERPGGPFLRHPVPLPPRAAHSSPHLHGMWCRFYFRPVYNYGHEFDFPWRRPPYRHPPYVPYR